jgi:hypothetical protein
LSFRPSSHWLSFAERRQCFPNNSSKNTKAKPGMVTHDCNPSTWETEAESRGSSLGYTVRPCLKNKMSRALEAHVYNPSYLGGYDQEDCGSKPAWAKNSVSVPPPPHNSTSTSLGAPSHFLSTQGCEANAIITVAACSNTTILAQAMQRLRLGGSQIKVSLGISRDPISKITTAK